MEKERVESFEQLKVWQQAHALVMQIFKLTPTLPSEYQESIAAAMERTAVDVPRGIAEGFKRRGSNNKAHHYNLSQSALESLRYYLILCRDLNVKLDFENLSRDVDEIARMLDGLVRSVMRSRHEGSNMRGRGRYRGRDGGRGRAEDSSASSDSESRETDSYEDDLVDEP